MEHWWNGSHEGKLEYAEKPVSLYHFARHRIPHAPAWKRTRAGDRPANNRLSHGTTNTEDMEFSQRF